VADGALGRHRGQPSLVVACPSQAVTPCDTALMDRAQPTAPAQLPTQPEREPPIQREWRTSHTSRARTRARAAAGAGCQTSGKLAHWRRLGAACFGKRRSEGIVPRSEVPAPAESRAAVHDFLLCRTPRCERQDVSDFCSQRFTRSANERRRFHCRRATCDGAVHVVLGGELDIAALVQLDMALRRAWSSGDLIVLDLRALEFIDSSGAQTSAPRPTGRLGKPRRASACDEGPRRRAPGSLK
jgi:hypothetical protein